VFNPLNIAREEAVEVSLKFPGGEPKAVRVYGPDGQEVPAQLSAGKVVFIAKVPSVGYAVYDVQAAQASMASALQVTQSSIENGRYRLTLDLNGDVACIFDKALRRELLYTPARLEIKTDNPEQWPAWNMDWEDQSRRPRAYIMRPAKVRVVETGPARAAIEVVREAEGSTFVQTIRLAAGDAGQRVEFVNAIDWMTKEAHLKAVFPLTASNPVATYNWDIGTIQRSTNNPKRFEVPSHQWVDLTDESGAFGVTVLSDCKYASDKPDDNTLRLTLLRTPGVRGGYEDQGTQDWGHHDFVYGLSAHGGDFRSGQTDWQGFRLNQPLVAFLSPSHPGALGKTFSLMSLDNSRIRVLALKKAEQSDEIVVRLVEMDGKAAQRVRIKFAAPVVAAREVTGTEMPLGKAEIVDGALAANFTPFQVRSYALKLAAATEKVAPPRFQPVSLPYDLRVASRDKAKTVAGFDGAGRCLAAEMLQGEIPYGGIRFRLASADKPNAVVARGQSIALPVVKTRKQYQAIIDSNFIRTSKLPTGEFNRVYVLAASADGDQKAVFRVGDQSVELTVQDWGGYIGQWDNRRWNMKQEPVPPRQPRPGEPPPAPPAKPRMRTVMEYLGLTPGFVKSAPVAWFASHRHTSTGENEAYAFSYVFAYALDLPPNATALTLPDNDKIRILAVTVASEPGQVRPVQNLVDAPQK
jgi:alpha-mannosidase